MFLLNLVLPPMKKIASYFVSNIATDTSVSTQDVESVSNDTFYRAMSSLKKTYELQSCKPNLYALVRSIHDGAFRISLID
jgi:hypothetical protein